MQLLFQFAAARGAGRFRERSANGDGRFWCGLAGGIQGSALVFRSAAAAELLKIGNSGDMFPRYDLVGVEDGLGAVEVGGRLVENGEGVGFHESGSKRVEMG